MVDYSYDYREGIKIVPSPKELEAGGYNLDCWVYIDRGEKVVAERIHIAGTRQSLEAALRAIRKAAAKWMDEKYPAL